MKIANMNNWLPREYFSVQMDGKHYGNYKTVGEARYVYDCLQRPCYHNREKRKTWEDLGEVERWSWERSKA
jgi:hypothetical protein